MCYWTVSSVIFGQGIQDLSFGLHLGKLDKQAANLFVSKGFPILLIVDPRFRAF